MAGAPRPLAIPEDLMAQINTEAAATGASPQEVLRRWSSQKAGPMARWSMPPYQELPRRDPPKSLSEAVRDMMETRMSLQLVKAIEGESQGSRGTDPQAIASAVGAELARVLDDRLPRRRRGDEDDDDMEFKSLERMLTRKAKLQMLKDFAKDDQQTSKFVDSQLQALNARIESAEKARAQTAEELHRTQLEAVSQRAAATEALLNDRTASLEARIEELQHYRSAGVEPPKDTLEAAIESASKLEKLRSALGGTGGKPDTWDRVERALDKAADLGGKMLEGVAAVEAGKRGVPPHAAIGPQGPPNYLPESGPMPGSGGDEVIEMADGSRIPVAALPDNQPYSIVDPATGQQRTVTKDEFVSEWRKEVRERGRATIRNDTGGAAAPPVKTEAPAPPAPAAEERPHVHVHAAPSTTPPAPTATNGKKKFNPFTREWSSAGDSAAPSAAEPPPPPASSGPDAPADTPPSEAPAAEPPPAAPPAAPTAQAPVVVGKDGKILSPPLGSSDAEPE